MTGDVMAALPAGNELNWTEGHVLSRMIGAKQISPVEVMESVLRQIDQHEAAVAAFAWFGPYLALDKARVAERRIMSGAASRPLEGLPVTIKDLSDAAGLPTGFGSVSKPAVISDVDAPFVERLKAAGAIVIGKTTTAEFGWKAVSNNPHTGITHNPWRYGYTAGGSSSGAAAACAAGFGPFHQGSDGAGSVRLPAHFCGVYGLKPTYGRIANYPIANTDYSSCIGPITRTVKDAALLLNVMAGNDARDHTSLPDAQTDYFADLERPLRPLRIAYSPDLAHAAVDNQIGELIDRTVASLASHLGLEIEFVRPIWGPMGAELIRFFWPVHFSQFAEAVERSPDMFEPGFAETVRAGSRFSVVDYQTMRMKKIQYCSEISCFFGEWDILLTPSASVAAFPADLLQPEHWTKHDWDWMRWAEFSYPFNLSGNPAASVTCGSTAEGLPVGIQVVGARFREDLVLRVSAALEGMLKVASNRPDLAALHPHQGLQQ
jgi:aspartyl-tRNA(Asn)/glutamyl-tRNA(Gln) amidotransferase subunit A